MGQVAGRSSEARSVATVGTTSGSPNLTFPSGALTAVDVGRAISGTGIPAAATIATVSSATAGTLSANATATGSITATVGDGSEADSARYGFRGWSPESAAEALTHTIAGGAGASSPDRITNTTTSRASLQPYR